MQMRCRIYAEKEPYQPGVQCWRAEQIALQLAQLQECIQMWQGSHSRFVCAQQVSTGAQNDSSSDADEVSTGSHDDISSNADGHNTEKETQGAIACIAGAMSIVPCDTILWHGTPNVNWSYKPHQWLACSLTTAGETVLWHTEPSRLCVKHNAHAVARHLQVLHGCIRMSGHVSLSSSCLCLRPDFVACAI